jgi:hypothetical protein
MVYKLATISSLTPLYNTQQFHQHEDDPFTHLKEKSKKRYPRWCLWKEEKIFFIFLLAQ